MKSILISFIDAMLCRCHYHGAMVHGVIMKLSTPGGCTHEGVTVIGVLSRQCLHHSRKRCNQ